MEPGTLCDDAPWIPHARGRHGGGRDQQTRGMLGDVPCEAWRLCDILAAFPRIAANGSAYIIVRLTRPVWRGRSAPICMRYTIAYQPPPLYTSGPISSQ